MSLPMYDKYFNTFAGNSSKGHRYQLILSSREVIDGIPVASGAAGDTGTFNVRLDSGQMREIPWKSLLTAAHIG